MTNREKFAEKILDVACSSCRLAVNKATLEPTTCFKLACKDCLFNFRDSGSCGDARKKWANSEYVEPSVDWSKVPVDTPILVNNTEDDDWMNRYFAEYKNGTVYAWYNGATSWSSKNKKCPWEYAKLVESEG